MLGVDAHLVGEDEGMAANWRRDWTADGAFLDPDAHRGWACALRLLRPVEVGDAGQVKEWYDEGAPGRRANGSPLPDHEERHRHLSHLLVFEACRASGTSSRGPGTTHPAARR